MSKIDSKSLDFLKSITTTSGKVQSELIIQSSDDNIKAVAELVYNLLQGNLQINDKVKSELQQHKIFLRKLSNANISVDTKRKSIFRKRKVLSIILTPIVSALTTLLAKAVANCC